MRLKNILRVSLTVLLLAGLLACAARLQRREEPRPVPDAVLTRLRELGISYIFAGQEKLNLPLMLEKLRALFGIERAMLTGGGATNWAFLAAGCIDEISLIVAPLADGGRDTATLFDRSAFAPAFAPNFVPVSLELLGTETLPGDALWLRYTVRP